MLFRSELQCDTRPWIEAYLQGAEESLRDPLLRELLILELDYRWRAGESVDEASYLQRFAGREALVQQAIRDATAYITHSPCFHCLKTLVNTGIRTIYFEKPYKLHTLDEIVQHADVTLRQVEMP